MIDAINQYNGTGFSTFDLSASHSWTCRDGICASTDTFLNVVSRSQWYVAVVGDLVGAPLSINTATESDARNYMYAPVSPDTQTGLLTVTFKAGATRQDACGF